MHNGRKCAKCGSVRTRVVAQSVTPPGEFVQCQGCGHSTLTQVSAQAPPPPGVDVDKRRIERLVTGAIEARRLPCRLLSVNKTTAGWRVHVRTPVGDFVNFDVPADSLAAMRAAIDRALAAEAS